MNELFLKIINMSISASWLVLAVLILRFVLKKSPKWVNVLLWGIVAVRLICPFSFESALSLIPSAETFPDQVISGPSFDVQTGIAPVDNRINDYLGDRYFEGVTVPTNNGNNVMTILTIVWIIGILLLVTYTIISYQRLNRKIDTAVRYKDNIFQSENVSSPFVLGIIKPRIYLPFKMDSQDLEHVVAHEQAHIRRKDHWWKPLGFLLLTIHWFNPLMWLAYVLLCRDIELACDEKVIKELGNEQRADYAQALVACSVNRRMIAACPLAFGEAGVKEKVKAIMNYKKPAFWIVVLAVTACIVVAVCFLTNPIRSNDDTQEDKYYLLIGTDGVLDVEVSTPNTSGGCRNADNSPFKKGEKVWLEQLNSDSDLRGVTITALDAEGNVIYTFSVPENATDDEITRLVGGDSWLIAPTSADTQSSETIGNANAEKYFGFRKKDYEVREETDTHGGFHGDGAYHLIMDCSENKGKALEIVNSWNQLPLSENLNLIMYGGERDGMTYGFNLAELANMPTIENGCYCFYDRHSESTDSGSDANLFDRASFNFSLAVYDFDTNMMYYFEYDT